MMNLVLIQADAEEDIDEDNYFIAMMGGAAIKTLLSDLDVCKL